jgi:diguanylate cyclase (GGDEF)-like protein
MTSLDRALKLLLELGDPAARRTRAEQLDHALCTLLALTDGDAAVVLAPSSKRGERLVMHAGSTGTAILPPPAMPSEVVRSLTENPQPMLVADLADESRVLATDGCPGVEAGPVMFAALRQRDPVPGYIAVYRRRGRARFASADTRAIVLLAACLASSLEVLRLASGAEKVALTDDLTQVYNARFLKTALKRELKRAGRFGQELSVVLAGVDRLDAWTETHGDLRGSVLIKEVATLLAQQVRSFDMITRYGNDQFMAVLPQTGRQGALEVAERMRACIEQNTFSGARRGAITVSLGVSSFPQDGAEVPGILASAERALVRAQEQGTNRIESQVGRAA